MNSPENIKPLISICMVTYNHSNWIANAIEGVLLQITSFPFELVVSDDCSTDNTTEIIKQYINSRPGIIRLLHNSSNLGLAKNFSQTLNKCSGKYIAICEGDDFWTDPLKMQKQVDFLESNTDCVISSHNYCALHHSGNRTVQQAKYYSDFHYDQERFLKEWVTQPLTCVFRNIFRDYTLLNREGIFCDVILFYELLKHGNGYFIKDNMATFRITSNALSSGLSQWQWMRNHVIMYDYLFKHNNRDHLLQGIGRKYCLSLYIIKLKGLQNTEYDFRPLKEYFKRDPGLFDRLLTITVKVPYYLFKYGLFNRSKPVSSNEQ